MSKVEELKAEIQRHIEKLKAMNADKQVQRKRLEKVKKDIKQLNLELDIYFNLFQQ